ncbi:phosphonate ABC transporter substrate-binding protein [Roseinatronobacter alkalisoli]|uniref:Phosphonate ABC transporter substrate-binding protein n=1 Tax=Roseinatronobacter alkalisoli TaxID=3028235 RepID=A0ABT5T6B8_9RHOB|nr:phosphonate ABC transporter substrate-binding protein [Roseinatronobacter sp. HJB301]MDD7970664.1 phosphonate ABC transporter substrate-binding protein [Roseinatronobacter sp. HJB301]
MTKTFTGVAATLAVLMTSVMPVAADWRADFGTYNIGLLGGENEADRLRRYDCFADLMSDALGVPVELFPASDYAGVMQGLLAGQLHQAGVGASAYAGVYLQDPEAVSPLLTTKNVDDSLGYYAVIYVSADSDARTLDDLEGMSLAYADPNSTSGYLVPRAELAAAGIDDTTYFSRTGFGGGHEQAVIAVLNGQYDAGVTWTSLMGEESDGYTRGNLRRMVDNGLLDMNDIRIVWESNLIPNGPTIFRNDLPEDARDLAVSTMLGLKEQDPECYADTVGGDGNGYAEVDHSFYEGIVAMREAELAGSR